MGETYEQVAQVKLWYSIPGNVQVWMGLCTASLPMAGKDVPDDGRGLDKMIFKVPSDADHARIDSVFTTCQTHFLTCSLPSRKRVATENSSALWLQVLYVHTFLVGTG